MSQNEQPKNECPVCGNSHRTDYGKRMHLREVHSKQIKKGKLKYAEPRG